MNNRSNEEWVQELSASGPPAAAAQEELRGFIRSVLLRGLSTRGNVDESTVEDFTQDSLIKVMDKLASFRGESRFTTWVTAVAMRTAFTELRRARWKDVSLSEFGVEAPVPAKETSPADRMDRQQIVELVHRVIQEQLSDKQRQALLAEFAGVPQAVLAEQLGTNRNALYKLTHDARKRLKQGILATGISENEVRSALDL